jgi:hypothetical protein
MALTAWNGQDEFGGHSFVTDTGAELYVPDSPEAQRYAAQLQAAPQPDYEARGGRTTLDINLGGQSGPPQAPPSVPDVAPVRVVQQGPKGPVIGRPMQAGMQTGAIAPAAQEVAAYNAIPTLPGAAPQEGAAPGSAYGLTPQEEALYNRIPAGSPGTTQQSILKKVGQGVAVPSAYSLETSGAVPENPEIEAAWVGAKKAEFDAQKSIAEQNAAIADAQRAAAANAAVDEQMKLITAQERQRVMREEADRKIQAVHAFDQEAQARYADFGPDRLFKQKGTWATIGAAIMQGLGAWAAITGHTQNYAMEIIQNAQKRDIEAQRDEYMRDKDARNNLVADIARATGDLDVATEAAKAIQLNIAAAHAGEMAALSKRTDVANNWQLFQAQFQAGVVEHMQKAYERGLGNTVIKQSAQFEYPKAGGGGGFSYKDLEARELSKTKVVEARQKRGQATGGSLPDVQEKQVEELAKRLDPVVKLEQSIKNVKAAGLESSGSGLVGKVPGVDLGTDVASALGSKSAARRQQKRAAFSEFVFADTAEESGASVPEKELERRTQNKEGQLSTMEARKAAIERAQAKVDAKKRNFLSGVPKAVREEYFKRYGQTLVEEKKREPGKVP